MVENFLGIVKNWSQWVVGQSPLPDRRSKIILGGVLAVGATLAVALIVAVGSPATKGHHPTSQAASIATPLPYSAGSTSPTSTMPAMPAVRTASTAKGAAHSPVGKKGTRGAAVGRRHHRNTGLHHPKQSRDREVVTA
jgi:hypothetical protein